MYFLVVACLALFGYICKHSCVCSHSHILRTRYTLLIERPNMIPMEIIRRHLEIYFSFMIESISLDGLELYPFHIYYRLYHQRNAIFSKNLSVAKKRDCQQSKVPIVGLPSRVECQKWYGFIIIQIINNIPTKFVDWV